MRLRHRSTGVVVNVIDDKPMGARWEPLEDKTSGGSQPAGESSAPPKSGRGSGRQAWADYATSLGVDVDDDMTRDDIIDEVEGG